MIMPEEQTKISKERTKKLWEEKKKLAKRFKFHAVYSLIKLRKKHRAVGVKILKTERMTNE